MGSVFLLLMMLSAVLLDRYAASHGKWASQTHLTNRAPPILYGFMQPLVPPAQAAWVPGGTAGTLDGLWDQLAQPLQPIHHQTWQCNITKQSLGSRNFSSQKTPNVSIKMLREIDSS